MLCLQKPNMSVVVSGVVTDTSQKLKLPAALLFICLGIYKPSVLLAFKIAVHPWTGSIDFFFLRPSPFFTLRYELPRVTNAQICNCTFEELWQVPALWKLQLECSSCSFPAGSPCSSAGSYSTLSSLSGLFCASPPAGWFHHSFFIYSSIDRHLGCCWLLSINEYIC